MRVSLARHYSAAGAASNGTRGGGGRAFTLFEVLLALALILALSAGLFSYIWNLIDRRERLVVVAQQQAAAGALFEELERNLATTFAADATGESGIKGTSDDIQVRCRGVAGVASLSGAPDLGDVQGTDVKFAGGAISARRVGKAEGEFEVVAGGIERVRFRYFYEQRWNDTVESAGEGGLPSAVEAAVWFGPSLEKALDEPPTRAPDRVRVMVVPDGAAKGGV